MLYTYQKCLTRIPMQRIVFTGAIASFFTVFILYIALTKNDRINIKKSQIMVEKKDYNLIFINDDKMLINYDEETQIETFWGEEDDDYDEMDDEEYESFMNSDEVYEGLSETEMKIMDLIMSERRQHVKDVCRDFRIDETGDVNAYEFLINDKYHLIWCNIFKAASTSWMYNFNLMAGFTKEEAENSPQPQAMARERYPRPSVEELKNASANSTSMIIVRHPFERLSSAYRDKMQSSPLFSMYSNLAEKIVHEYRRPESGSDEDIFSTPWPTFEEFIRYVIDEANSGKTMDIHWAPYTSFCTPCHYDFDVIAKFETLELDQKYLIQKAGLRNVITPQWKNSGGSKSMNPGISSNDLMLAHYSQLTSDQITALYEIYRYDFLIFNYTIDQYYQMASDRMSDEMMPFGFFDYWDDDDDDIDEDDFYTFAESSE